MDDFITYDELIDMTAKLNDWLANAFFRADESEISEAHHIAMYCQYAIDCLSEAKKGDGVEYSKEDALIETIHGLTLSFTKFVNSTCKAFERQKITLTKEATKKANDAVERKGQRTRLKVLSAYYELKNPAAAELSQLKQAERIAEAIMEKDHTVLSHLRNLKLPFKPHGNKK